MVDGFVAELVVVLVAGDVVVFGVGVLPVDGGAVTGASCVPPDAGAPVVEDGAVLEAGGVVTGAGAEVVGAAAVAA